MIFADISLPFLGLGVPFSIDPGLGPVVRHPIRTGEEVEAIGEFNARASVGFVGKAIERFLELEPERPIIGFAGGPFTLAAYLIEGGPSREYVETKRLLYSDPATFDKLIGRLTEMTVDYLTLQARSGAAALQLFDTWVGAVTPTIFEQHLLGPITRIFEEIRPLGRPTIYFSTGSSHLLELLARTGADALGVDWREPLDRVRGRVGERVTIPRQSRPWGTPRVQPNASTRGPPSARRGRRRTRTRIQFGPRRSARNGPRPGRRARELRTRGWTGAEEAMNPTPPAETTAVLLMGYGSPNGVEDLPSYLADVLHGRTPSPAMVAEYDSEVRTDRRVAPEPHPGLAPREARATAAERSAGRAVFLGVKHGQPALRTVIPEAARAGFRHLIAVPLSPYASTWISEPYQQGVEEGTRASASPISVDVRLDWHLDPHWIGYWGRAIRLEQARHPDPKGVVLLSAHSLPQAMRNRGDPYPEILQETYHRIVRSARLQTYVVHVPECGQYDGTLAGSRHHGGHAGVAAPWGGATAGSLVRVRVRPLGSALRP